MINRFRQIRVRHSFESDSRCLVIVIVDDVPIAHESGAKVPIVAVLFSPKADEAQGCASTHHVIVWPDLKPLASEIEPKRDHFSFIIAGESVLKTIIIDFRRRRFC